MTTITRRENRRVPPSAWAILLVIGVVLSVTFAITFGPASITAGGVWSSVLSHLGLGASPLTPLRDGIVWQLRLPRVLTAAAVVGPQRATELFEAAYDEHGRRLARLFASLGE